MKWMLVAISISTYGELETWSVGDFTDHIDCEIYRSELAYSKTTNGIFPINEEAVCVPWTSEEFRLRWDQELLDVPIPKTRGNVAENYTKIVGVRG